MAQTITLTTEQFTCPSCVAKIEKTLDRTPGVLESKVRFTSNKVEASIDEAVTDANTIADIVSGLGYAVLKTKVR
ncbi:cation transporter [Actinomyces minihominis]|uniref:cation transporter n=1 Tax=Actinomyces minihominis TaxID=2002838 RepID=UPI000C06860C|nr:cation transporter [Actinomyces minihominis]